MEKIQEVLLSVDEQRQYDTVRRILEGNQSPQRAALILGVTGRTIRNYISGFRKAGAQWFVHGNRGRKPARTIAPQVQTQIADLYQSKYYDASYSHAKELLEKKEGIGISESSVRKILLSRNLLSPQVHKKTRRQIQRKLERAKKSAGTEAQQAAIEKEIARAAAPHPRRERCPYFGEMIQMDASEHPWFGTQKATLHAAIDNSTGIVVGAYFERRETLSGYYHVFHQILETYGIPYMFYTDNRTVFRYKKKKNPALEKDSFTQFSYACHQLGVDVKTTSVPQAKGQIERLFGTLQQRLPVELRLAGISAMDAANEFLRTYLDGYNEKFSKSKTDLKSVFDLSPGAQKINLTLAVLTKRTIDKGHSVSFQNHYYRTVDHDGIPFHLAPRTEGLLVEAFDKTKYFCTGGRVLALEEIRKHEEVSSNIDRPAGDRIRPPQKKNIPAMGHPWRMPVFDSFLGKQAHRRHLAGA
ncbi:MAG: ISNCY family transposase [Clostridium sp.]|jgi:transposase|nr:ISNCY family transposase [Clostridium sp.]